MATQVARIGVMCITNGEDTLKAILGSCVGIAIFWKKRKLYCLSHCLLADPLDSNSELNAKYVSDAIPLMLQAMENSGRQRFELEAVVVGGGTMLQKHGNCNAEKIGPNNLEAARKHLAKHNVNLAHLENAGKFASQIIVDGQQGTYEVVLIPKLESDT